MNDGMFTALRGIGQETNSLLTQLLAEQKRTNEMLSQLAAGDNAHLGQSIFYPNVKIATQLPADISPSEVRAAKLPVTVDSSDDDGVKIAPKRRK